MPKDLFEYCYTSNTTSEKIKMFFTNLEMLDIAYKVHESGDTDRTLRVVTRYKGIEYSIRFYFKIHNVSNQMHLEETVASITTFGEKHELQTNLNFNKAIQVMNEVISKN